MDGLNYHHLHYFWKVAKTGSIAKASLELKLTQPTISEQIRHLENACGHKLFRRVGRSLALTPTGREVYQYAEKIFALGGELSDVLRGTPAKSVETLQVGVEHGIPGSVVERLLAPVMRAKSAPLLEVRYNSANVLRTDLASGEMTIGLSTMSLKGSGSKLYAHLLLECGAVFLDTRGGKGRTQTLAKRLADRPLLLPSSPFGEGLKDWFRRQDIEPQIAMQSDSEELLRNFGQRGLGIVVCPEYPPPYGNGLKLLGRTNSIRWRCYALTRERRPRDRHLAAILAGAIRTRAQAR